MSKIIEAIEQEQQKTLQRIERLNAAVQQEIRVAGKQTKKSKGTGRTVPCVCAVYV